MTQPSSIRDSLVSVIIANYNKVEYVEESLRSVLNQSYRNLQVIIVDDGSTDGSQETIKRVALSDSRVLFISSEHVGKIKAFNLAASMATGDYVKIWGSDDLLKENAISSLLHEIEGYDVVGHNSTVTDDKLNVIKPKSVDFNTFTKGFDIPDVLRGLGFPSGCYFFKKNIFDTIFPIPDEASYEDWYIFMIIVLNNYRINYYDRSLALYRQVKNSAYGGANNFSLKTKLYRAERDLRMLNLFEKIVPLQHLESLNSIKIETHLFLHSTPLGILKSNLTAKRKVILLITKYLNFILGFSFYLKRIGG